MSTLVMYDSADPATLPPWDGKFAVAGYVDGYADFPEIRAKYPRARVMSITGHGGIAECADVERWLMADADGPGWYRKAIARGVWRPVLYREASAAAGLIEVMAQAGIARGEYRLWTAHYESEPHLCGPSTCRYPQGDATQWTSNALGRSLDQSLLTAGFFGTAVPPALSWTEKMLKNLPVVRQGDTGPDVRTVQALCCARGYPTVIDGKFGADTLERVKEVQRAAGLAQDGKVGPETWPALAAAT